MDGFVLVWVAQIWWREVTWDACLQTTKERRLVHLAVSAPEGEKHIASFNKRHFVVLASWIWHACSLQGTDCAGNEPIFNESTGLRFSWYSRNCDRIHFPAFSSQLRLWFVWDGEISGEVVGFTTSGGLQAEFLPRSDLLETIPGSFARAFHGSGMATLHSRALPLGMSNP